MDHNEDYAVETITGKNADRAGRAGKFLGAIQEFYGEDATMQENNQPPRLAALLENERRVLASLKDVLSRA